VGRETSARELLRCCPAALSSALLMLHVRVTFLALRAPQLTAAARQLRRRMFPGDEVR
jgi:hypothetical protein